MNASQRNGYIHKYPADSEKIRAVTDLKIFLFTEEPKWEFIVEPCTE